MLEVAGHVPAVRWARVVGDQELDRAADEASRFVAEDGQTTGVGGHDATVAANDKTGIGNRVDQRPERHALPVALLRCLPRHGSRPGDHRHEYRRGTAPGA